MRILFFGDSICYGDGVRADQAWVSLVKAKLRGANATISITNAGLNGDTTAGAIMRLPFFMGSKRQDIVYIQFGLNDSWSGLVNLEQYVQNIHKIVNYALANGVKKIILANNHPVCLEEVPYGFCTQEFRDNVKNYNAAIRERFANLDKIILLDIEKAFASLSVTEQISLLQEDGVHVSVKGNIFYCELIFPMIEECLNDL